MQISMAAPAPADQEGAGDSLLPFQGSMNRQFSIATLPATFDCDANHNIVLKKESQPWNWGAVCDAKLPKWLGR